MSIEGFAEGFSSAGYACLMFDYRRWGASGKFLRLAYLFGGTDFSPDGTPRNVIVVKEQLEDYRTVLRYARQQSELDGKRLILWGSSFSGAAIPGNFILSGNSTSDTGGHVTTLAAEVLVLFVRLPCVQ